MPQLFRPTEYTFGLHLHLRRCLVVRLIFGSLVVILRLSLILLLCPNRETWISSWHGPPDELLSVPRVWQDSAHLLGCTIQDDSHHLPASLFDDIVMRITQS